MKATKPLIIAALVAGSLLASDLVLQAQGVTNTPPPVPPVGGPPPGSSPGGPGMRGRPDLDMIARQLNLTDDQKSQLQSVLAARMQKMRGLMQNTNFVGLSLEDRKAKVKAVRDETEMQIKNLLTPQQYSQWQKLSGPGMRGHSVAPFPVRPTAENSNAPVPPPFKGPGN